MSSLAKLLHESDDSFYSCKTGDSSRASSRSRNSKMSLEDDSEIQIPPPIENLTNRFRKAMVNKQGSNTSSNHFVKKNPFSSSASDSVKTPSPTSPSSDPLNLLNDGTEESAKKFLQSLYPDTPIDKVYRPALRSEFIVDEEDDDIEESDLSGGDESDDDAVSSQSSSQSTPSIVKKKEVQRYQECDDSHFLRSLVQQLPESIKTRHPDAPRFVNSFKRNREALVTKLYRIYNEKIFESKLPIDLSIEWNQRLRKTAGWCRMRKGRFGDRSAVVELSVKVCDSADRVRDTLVHELCHAAVWLVDGSFTDKHGPLWKTWARRCSFVFPCLPIIERCHHYDIRTKYTYKCSGCDQQIHRHSKSLDISRKICGRCQGTFTLIVNYANNNKTTKVSDCSNDMKKPKATPKFALFVKENYASAKATVTSSNSEDGIRTSHKDVMQMLSQKFKRLNLPNLESSSSTSSANLSPSASSSAK